MINEKDDKYKELKKKLMETGELRNKDYEYMYKHCEKHLIKVFNQDQDESFWACIIDNDSIKNYESDNYSNGINLMICNDTLSGYFAGVFVTATERSGGGLPILPCITTTIGYKLNVLDKEENKDG